MLLGSDEDLFPHFEHIGDWEGRGSAIGRGVGGKAGGVWGSEGEGDQKLIGRENIAHGEGGGHLLESDRRMASKGREYLSHHLIIRFEISLRLIIHLTMDN